MEVKYILVRQSLLLYVFVCMIQCMPPAALGQTNNNASRTRAQISADKIYSVPRDKRTLDILLKGLAEALGYELKPRKPTTNAPSVPVPASPTQASVPAPPSPTRPTKAEATTAKGTNNAGNDLVAVKGSSQTDKDASNSDDGRRDEQINSGDDDTEIANYYRNHAGDHFRNEYDRIRGFDANGNQIKQQDDGDNQSYNEESSFDQPWNLQLYNEYKEVPDDKSQSQTKRDEEQVDAYYNYQIPPPSTQSWENLFYFGNDGSQSNYFQATSENPSYDSGRLIQFNFGSPQGELQNSIPTEQFEDTDSNKDEANSNQQSGGTQIIFIPNSELHLYNGGKMSSNIQNSVDGKLPIASTSKPKMAQILQQNMEGSKDNSLWPAPFHYSFDNGNNAVVPHSQQQLLKNDAVIGEKAQLLVNINPEAKSLAYASPESDKSSQNWSGQNTQSNQNANNANTIQQNTSPKKAGNNGNAVQQLSIPQNSYNLPQPISGAIPSLYPTDEQSLLAQYLTPPQNNPSVNYFSSPQLPSPNLNAKGAATQGEIQLPAFQQTSRPNNPNAKSQTTTSREFGAYAALFIPHTAFGSGFGAVAKNILAASPAPLTGLFLPNNNNKQETNQIQSQSVNFQQLDQSNHLRNDRHASTNIHNQAKQNNVEPKAPSRPIAEAQRNSKIQQDSTGGNQRGRVKSIKSPPVKTSPSLEKKQNLSPHSPTQGDRRHEPHQSQRFQEQKRVEGHDDYRRYHDDYVRIPNYRYDATERQDQEPEEKDDSSYWKSFSYNPPESSGQYYKAESSESPEKSHERASFSVLSPLSDDYTNLDYFYGGNQEENVPQQQQEQNFQRRSDEVDAVSPTASNVEQKTVHWGMLTIPPPTEYKEPAGLGDRWEEEEPKGPSRTVTKETISRVSKVHVTGKVHFYPEDVGGFTDGRIVTFQ